MLVQRLGLSLPDIKHSRFAPTDIGGLSNWWKFQTKITADQDASGGAVSHSTTQGNMDIDDRINQWLDIVGSNNATQTDTDDKPRWNTYGLAPAGTKPNCFFGGNQWLDMASDVSINANKNFSIMAHVVFTDLSTRAVYGSDTNNFFRINSAAGFRCKIGGAGNQNFTEASDVIAINTDYFVTIQRSNGATGNLACYVHGGTYEDKTWGSTANTDPDAFTINNIGAGADDANEFKGVIKNLLIYKDTVLTSVQRKQNYVYLNSLL
tara:strand:- start:1307 stop:2101 length:795 start_codon:yes stop_codon:yes gene_type:complete